MGRAVLRAARDVDGIEAVAAFDRPGVTDGDSEGVPLLALEDCLGAVDVAIDFTAPDASARLARLAADRRQPALVIGTTGLSEDQEAVVTAAAERIAVVRSGNFSLGVNVLLGLAEQAARRLSAAEWDVEILEAHHRRKLDAPSGTALMLGEAAARGRGVRLHEVRGAPRQAVNAPRRTGEIGFAVLRGGGVVGDHSITFAAEDELLTLSHSARDRSLFARGALTAARWVVGRPPGLYDMQDVLGFTNQS